MTNDDKILPKTASKFLCEICNFNTSRLSQYNTHLLTAKHKKLTNDDANPSVLSAAFECGCGNIYKHRQGLHNHKKKCTNIEENKSVRTNPVLDNSTVFEILKQNQDFKDLLIEQHKKILELSNAPRIINNNVTNNTQNNHFNLQLFLNETCKDAITADQFVKDILISFHDLENIGNQGYVQGFTDIIMKQLRMLDVTKRPLHCTDVKRETIYIKDNNSWNKDTDDKTKLRNVIEKVAMKSRANVNRWQREHPDVVVLDSTAYEMNHKILRHTWGDGDTNKLQEKVIKNIAKEIHVDKDNLL